MAVVLATERKVSFYGSENLKSWTHLSDFGPANATGGVWEVPDLFPLAVDGKRKQTKWVLIVNLNPGGIAGGSGAQYFVGDFDGTTFRADNVVGDYTPPAGELYEGFEGASFGDWSTTGNAFGSGPSAGNVPPQGGVEGYLGNGLANSFHDEDRGTGTLTSPAFTITRPYLNFLVGGGNHPHDPATVDAPPPAGTVLADFEGDTYGEGWTTTGTFAGTRPPAGTIGDQQPVSGYEGNRRAAIAHPAIYPPRLPATTPSDGAVRSLTRPSLPHGPYGSRWLTKRQSDWRRDAVWLAPQQPARLLLRERSTTGRECPFRPDAVVSGATHEMLATDEVRAPGPAAA